MRLSRKLQIVFAIGMASFSFGSCESDEQTGSSRPTVDTAGRWVQVGLAPDQSFFELQQTGVTSSGSALLFGQRCTPSDPKFDMSFFGNVEGNRVSGWITTTITPLSCSTAVGGNCEGMDPVPAFSEPINLIFNGEISYHEEFGYCVFEMDFTMDMPGGMCDGDTGAVIMYFCPRETPFSPCELIDACPTPADGV